MTLEENCYSGQSGWEEPILPVSRCLHFSLALVNKMITGDLCVCPASLMKVPDGSGFAAYWDILVTSVPLLRHL